MDVASLARTWDWLQQEGRGAAASPWQAAAAEGLNLMQSGGWLPCRIAAEQDEHERHFKPEAARRIEHQRDALLRLAAIEAFLRQGTALPGEGAAFVDELAQQVFHQAMRGLAGLRLPAGALAHEDAREAFETFVMARLSQLDRVLRTGFASAVREEAISDAGSKAEADAVACRWTRAWSCAVASAPLVWLKGQGCRSLPSLIGQLWYPSGGGPRGFRYKSPNDGASLPTGGRARRSSGLPGHHAELALPSILALIIEGRFTPAAGNPVVGPQASALVRVSLSLKAIDYVSVRGRVFYTGHNIFQFYLAMLVACLLQTNHGRTLDAGQARRWLAEVPRPDASSVSMAHSRLLRGRQAAGPQPPARAREAERPRPGAQAPRGTLEIVLRSDSRRGAPFTATVTLAAAALDDSVQWLDLVCMRMVPGRVPRPLPLQVDAVEWDTSGHLRLVLVPHDAAVLDEEIEAVLAALHHGHVTLTQASYGDGVFGVLEFGLPDSA